MIKFCFRDEVGALIPDIQNTFGISPIERLGCAIADGSGFSSESNGGSKVANTFERVRGTVFVPPDFSGGVVDRKFCSHAVVSELPAVALFMNRNSD